MRFELAKLHEHHAKDASRALALVAEGTGETDDQRAHREARLRAKVARGKVAPTTSRRRTKNHSSGVALLERRPAVARSPLVQERHRFVTEECIKVQAISSNPGAATEEP